MVTDIDFAPDEDRGWLSGVHYYVYPRVHTRVTHIGYAAQKGRKERKLAEIPIFAGHALSHVTLHMVLNEMDEESASHALDKPSITPIELIPYPSGIAPKRLYHQSRSYRKLVRRLKK